ncbi:MAG: hypothetical protein IJY53_08560 [Akkermansia sp.]|nr:hypothetical protein [Akkermansia sp.]
MSAKRHSGTSLIRPDRPQDHDPHPADQGLHFEQILGFWLSFCTIGNKIAGNVQQHAIHA